MTCIETGSLIFDLALTVAFAVGWGVTEWFRRRERKEWRAFLRDMDEQSGGKIAEWCHPNNPLLQGAMNDVFVAVRQRAVSTIVEPSQTRH